jgi:hypothetical protein
MPLIEKIIYSFLFSLIVKERFLQLNQEAIRKTTSIVAYYQTTF